MKATAWLITELVKHAVCSVFYCSCSMKGQVFFHARYFPYGFSRINIPSNWSRFQIITKPQFCMLFGSSYCVLLGCFSTSASSIYSSSISWGLPSTSEPGLTLLSLEVRQDEPRVATCQDSTPNNRNERAGGPPFLKRYLNSKTFSLQRVRFSLAVSLSKVFPSFGLYRDMETHSDSISWMFVLLFHVSP